MIVNKISDLKDKKISIVFADTNGFTNKNIAYKEKKLDIKELSKIDLINNTSKDCVLLIFVGPSQITNALELIKIWGFEYLNLFFMWSEPKNDLNIKIKRNGEMGGLFLPGFFKKIIKKIFNLKK
jgi:N6-adenosine-specific RNA methylase IME4